MQIEFFMETVLLGAISGYLTCVVLDRLLEGGKKNMVWPRVGGAVLGIFLAYTAILLGVAYNRRGLSSRKHCPQVLFC